MELCFDQRGSTYSKQLSNLIGTRHMPEVQPSVVTYIDKESLLRLLYEVAPMENVRIVFDSYFFG